LVALVSKGNQKDSSITMVSSITNRCLDWYLVD
jgi:hypothetical protein